MNITDDTTTTAGAGNDPGASAGTTASTPDETTLTQAQVNALLAKERRDTEKRLKIQADEQAAAARGEWELIAQQRTAERDAHAAKLEALEAQHAALTETLGKAAQKRLKALPEELRALAPADAAALLPWLDQAEAAAVKLLASANPGTPTGPRGVGRQTPTNSSADLVAQKRRQIGGL